MLCDLCVVPSVYQEPVALVPLEAMGVGLPVIITDVGGMKEYYDGKSLLKVSKISEVVDIEQIVFSKEWIEFNKNLQERNFDKILPTCKHQCQVREDRDKIKKEIFFDSKTGKMVWRNIR